MVRNDIEGITRAPKSLQEYLTGRGGRNRFAEPNYRLILASSRMKLQGGRWQDWDENVSLHDRGGFTELESGVCVPSLDKPRRIVEEVRRVPKYPGLDDGWIVERWAPAEFYGDRGAWNERCVPGTAIPLGGPFPDTGDYELCHYAASMETPSVTELEHVVERCEASRENYREDVRQVLLERMNAAQADYDRQTAKERDEMAAKLRDAVAPLWGGSLAAGRIRSALALRCGITEHVGN